MYRSNDMLARKLTMRSDMSPATCPGDEKRRRSKKNGKQIRKIENLEPMIRQPVKVANPVQEMQKKLQKFDSRLGKCKKNDSQSGKCKKNAKKMTPSLGNAKKMQKKCFVCW